MCRQRIKAAAGFIQEEDAGLMQEGARLIQQYWRDLLADAGD